MLKLDCLVIKGSHYIDHVAPVWNLLPTDVKGRFMTSRGLVSYAASLGIDADGINPKNISKELQEEKRENPVLLAGHADSQWTDAAGRKSIIIYHGTGFNFDKDHKLASYPGTTKHRKNVALMLVPNEHIAAVEQEHNPNLQVAVVGCPKLDRFHTGPKHRITDRKEPVIALAFHWRCTIAPEAGTAFDYYKDSLSALAEQYTVLGHGHPLIMKELSSFYKQVGIEVIENYADLFDRADLLIADATSLQYEWATLDRPQVVLNTPKYRRDVDFGLRFWRHADVGVQCDDPADLPDCIEQAIKDTPEQVKSRHEAAEYAYAYRDGRASERAVEAIMTLLQDSKAVSTPSVTDEHPAAIRLLTNAIMGMRRYSARNIYRVPNQITLANAESLVSERKAVWVGASATIAGVKAPDDWLSRMGWRIPKDRVQLKDPDNWPDVALIIPVFNSPKLLGRCLGTLNLTKYPGKVNIQLVDNASTDKQTLKILEGYEDVIRFDEPVGFSEAVNTGMKAQSDVAYHVLYNQDVAVIDPDWLTHLIRWMENKPECAVCGPKLLYDSGLIENAGIDMGVGDGCAERGRGKPSDDPRFNEYRKVATVSGAVYCLRTSVEQRMGMFDERYLFGCEDLEYGMRVSAQLGMEVWYVPDSVLIHSSHSVQRENRADHSRIKAMHAISSEIYEREWGTYYNHLAATRIAIILPNFHSACGGARVAAALARQLSICGVQAEVFARKVDADPDKDFPRFSIRPTSELKSADIVIATRFDTLREASAVPAKRRIYFVQQIEDVMARNCGGTPAQALASYKDTRFEIITIGDHLSERLKDMGRDSTVLDVGLYVSLYPYAKRSGPSENLKVLMYGADGYKGPDQAAIAAEIRKVIPEVEINSFHRYAAEPKWSDKHFRPQITSEVAALYAEHDVYVYASESDGFAMTPVESMACGTPVVLSDFPGKDQYARNEQNCLIAKFRDPEGIAKAVSRVLSDKEVWVKLAVEGRKTAERYDWGKVGAQYAKAILEAKVET